MRGRMCGGRAVNSGGATVRLDRMRPASVPEAIRFSCGYRESGKRLCDGPSSRAWMPAQLGYRLLPRPPRSSAETRRPLVRRGRLGWMQDAPRECLPGYTAKRNVPLGSRSLGVGPPLAFEVRAQTELLAGLRDRAQHAGCAIPLTALSCGHGALRSRNFPAYLPSAFPDNELRVKTRARCQAMRLK